jgi:hypothetical protein
VKHKIRTVQDRNVRKKGQGAGLDKAARQDTT